MAFKHIIHICYRLGMEEDLDKIEVIPGTPVPSDNDDSSIFGLGENGSVESFFIIIEAPPPDFWRKFRSFLDRIKPVCPPPVCYLLTEQLIVFFLLASIALVGFLVYWFTERK